MVQPESLPAESPREVGLCAGEKTGERHRKRGKHRFGPSVLPIIITRAIILPHLPLV